MEHAQLENNISFFLFFCGHNSIFSIVKVNIEHTMPHSEINLVLDEWWRGRLFGIYVNLDEEEYCK